MRCSSIVAMSRARRRPLTLASLLIANVCTVIGFGLLSFPAFRCSRRWAPPSRRVRSSRCCSHALLDPPCVACSGPCGRDQHRAHAHGVAARCLRHAGGLRQRASTPQSRGAASTSICDSSISRSIIWAIAAPSSGSPAISCGRRARRVAARSGSGVSRSAARSSWITPRPTAGPWDGLCLLAPYPGNRLLITEIARAGASPRGSRGRLRSPTKNVEYGVHSGASRRATACLPGLRRR